MESHITVQDVKKHKKIEQVEHSLALVLQECQTSLGTHKRLLSVMLTLFEKSVALSENERFGDKFCDLINRALIVKKGQTAVDRIFRLVGGFVDAIEKDKVVNEEDEELDPASLFADQVVRHLLQGTSAKDKVVRYRCFQLIAIIVHQMSSMNNELYELIVEHATSRLRDREAVVRVQAIACLGAFQGSADDEEDEEDVDDPSKLILESMAHDPSPDVRKAALMHLQKSAKFKEAVVERARDENATVRKYFYATVVTQLGELGSKMRNDILTWGLNDREESVRLTAEKLFCYTWLESAGGDFTVLLQRLHVTRSTVAETAVKCFLTNRADFVSKVNLQEAVWRNLTPETALFNRVYYNYCVEKNMEEAIDKNFPDPVDMAELLEKYLKLRLDTPALLEEYKQKCADGEGVDKPLDKEEIDYVVDQLLKLLIDYDLVEEVGRRQILHILRDSLRDHELTDVQVESATKVIKKLAISERDFCHIIVEIATDIRDKLEGNGDIEDAVDVTAERVDKDDGDDDDDDDEAEATFVSAVSNLQDRSIDRSVREEPTQPSKEVPLDVARYILVILKCLFSCLDKEERMSSLDILMSGVVEPLFNIKEDEESEQDLAKRRELAELSLLCIAVRALLNVEYAVRAAFYCSVAFVHHHLEMKIIGLKALTDIIAVHGTANILVLPGASPEPEGSMKVITESSLIKMYYRTLRDDTQPELQAVSGESIFKLYLADVLTDDDLFETTLLAWYNPIVSANETLKQCLAFCIPTYCYSHITHQERLCRVAGDAIRRTFANWEDTKNTVAPTLDATTVLNQITVWSDPTRVVNITQDELQSNTNHITFAVKLLESLSMSETMYTNSAYLVPILSSLTKIFIGSRVDKNVLVQLLESMEALESDLLEDNRAYNRTARTAVSTFKSRVRSLIGDYEAPGSDSDIELDENSHTSAEADEEPVQDEEGDEAEEADEADDPEDPEAEDDDDEEMSE